MHQPALIQKRKPWISLWLDDSTEDYLKPVHCLVCGKIMFEYYGNVSIVVVGDSKRYRNPLIIQCGGTLTIEDNGRLINTRCKTKYKVE